MEAIFKDAQLKSRKRVEIRFMYKIRRVEDRIHQLYMAQGLGQARADSHGQTYSRFAT